MNIKKSVEIMQLNTWPY